MINDTSLDLMYEIKSKEFFSIISSNNIKPPTKYEVTEDNFENIFKYQEVKLNYLLPEELMLILKKNDIKILMLSMNNNWVECQFMKYSRKTLLCKKYIFHKSFIELTNKNYIGSYLYANENNMNIYAYRRKYSKIKLDENEFDNKYNLYLLEHYNIDINEIYKYFYKE